MNRALCCEAIALLCAVTVCTTLCCEIYRFVESPQVLEGHVIETIFQPIVNLCWGSCAWSTMCFSINARQTPQGMFECQLNNSSKKSNPHKMVAREGWSYYEMANISSVSRSSYTYRLKEDLGDGWYRYEDAAIKLFTEKKNWTDARKHCQSLGGDLLSITSSDKNNFVKEVFVKQLNLTYLRSDEPYARVPYDSWKLNKPESTVQLKGTSGHAEYKSADGGTALYFNGRQGYGKIPDFNMNRENFTIMYWFKPFKNDVKDGWIHPLRIDSTGPFAPMDCFFEVNRTSLLLYIGNVEQGYVSFEYGSWNHIAVSWNKNGATKGHFVINGTKHVSLKEANPVITGSEELRMGTREDAYMNINRTLIGFLKEIVLINETMSIPEIQTFLFWNEEHGAWIGLNDQENTGQLSWSDGTPVGQYMPFLREMPKPSVSGLKCVFIGKYGKWLDKLCNMEYPFICEKRL